MEKKNRYQFLLILIFTAVLFSCRAQNDPWNTFFIRNVVEGYANGRVVDQGDKWHIYFNKEVMICSYKDTFPIILTELEEGVEKSENRFDSYVDEFYICFLNTRKVIKRQKQDDQVVLSEITLDSLRHVMATFSIIPFSSEENIPVSSHTSGDTVINLFLAKYKPDISFPDSTYLMRIPTLAYTLPIPLFPDLDIHSLQTVGYKMIYNPVVWQGHNIPRREFSTILYSTEVAVPPEILKIYDEFKRTVK